MKVSYLTFLKHAEKVAKNAHPSRSVFQNVYHEGGFVYVTDSHRIYRAKCNYAAEEGAITNVLTGRKFDGEFPDVKAHTLISKDPVAIVELDVIRALDAFKALQQAGVIPRDSDDKKKRKDAVRLDITVEGDTATVSTVDSGITAIYEAPVIKKASNDVLLSAFNAEYMVQALALFKDAFKDAISTGTIKKLRWNIYGNLVPFTITADNAEESLLAIILPVRRV